MNFLRIPARIGYYARFAMDAQRFVRDEISPAQARAAIEQRLAARQQSFLYVIENGVYARPQSAYARLLQHANIGFDDLTRMVEQLGIEGALEHLYDAGVYLTVEELKGRRSIQRGDMDIPVAAADFSNPFMTGPGFALSSSGSTGAPTRAQVDFGFASEEAIYLALFLEAHGLTDHPTASLGFGSNLPLYFAKLGRPQEKYFVGGDIAWSDRRLRTVLSAKLIDLGAQILKRRVSWPEFSRHDQIPRAAQWLAEKKARGTPGFLLAFASPATRLCQMAQERGLDISGSYIRVVGEPYTKGKADIFDAAGVRAIVLYVSVETGGLGVSCATPTDLDDVHFFSHAFGVIQRQKQPVPGVSIGTLAYTSLTTTSPKLLLNAECGDYATLEMRDCGCLLGELGLTTHLSKIRSYEKLTSEGVTFMGSELHDLVEMILPARFGGSGADYQLVEEEVQGLPKVSILVSPRVGNIDEAALVETVLQALRTPEPLGELWTQMWSEENTLRVIRREPYQSGNAKVLPLHILRSGSTDQSSN